MILYSIYRLGRRWFTSSRYTHLTLSGFGGCLLASSLSLDLLNLKNTSHLGMKVERALLISITGKLTVCSCLCDGDDVHMIWGSNHDRI